MRGRINVSFKNVQKSSTNSIGTLYNEYSRGGVPPTVTQRMSPLGVAQWKIEIAYSRGAVPQTVTQRMSPLGVAQWKIKTDVKT